MAAAVTPAPGWAPVVAVLAAALCCWPGVPGRAGPRQRTTTRWTPAAAVVAVPPAALVLVGAGPAPACAAVLVALTVRAGVRRAVAARRRDGTRVAMAAALAALSRELRSGTEPVVAAAEVARWADPAVAPVFSRLARDGGRPATGTGARAGPPGAGGAAAADVAARLGRGLLLAERHGIRFAALVDAVARDVTDEVETARARAAETAGPRFSGWVLAVLPGLGLLLGHGMGADPVGVLLGTPVGGVLLVVGTALACAGVWWADRIVQP